MGPALPVTLAFAGLGLAVLIGVIVQRSRKDASTDDGAED